jgi:hypothetical protein
MSAASVELSIQLQIDNIAAVKEAIVGAMVGREQNTLWWLMDYSHDITYLNQISGTEMLAIDNKIDTVDLGSSVFGSWFGMHNAYFSTIRPIPNVSTVRQAIETFYRWRVSSYFSDIMLSASADQMTPQYVFPNDDFELGTYVPGSTATTLGTFTSSNLGGANMTTVGPGILVVKPIAAMLGDLAVDLTALCQDNSTTVPVPVSLLLGAEPTVPVPLGGQQLTAAAWGTPPPSPPGSPPPPPPSPPSPPSSMGVVSVADTSLFRANMWVLLREQIPASSTSIESWKTEIAEVQVVGSGSLTLRQPTPTGSTTPFSAGLRNDFSTSAEIFPLFINVIGASAQTAGDASDSIWIGFDPDRPQDFISLAGISYPQMAP